MGDNGILGDIFFKRIIQKAIKKDHNAIQKYRVEQTDKKNFKVYIQKGPTYVDNIKNDIVSLTLEKLGSYSNIKIIYTNEFPVLPSGKSTFFQTFI